MEQDREVLAARLRALSAELKAGGPDPSESAADRAASIARTAANNQRFREREWAARGMDAPVAGISPELADQLGLTVQDRREDAA